MLIYNHWKFAIEDFNIIKPVIKRFVQRYHPTKKIGSCHYPFKDFITDRDKELFNLCKSRVKMLYEAEAKTWEEAQTFYLDHYGTPPTFFKQWYQFANANNCRINRYDQLQSQLSPFKNKSTNFAEILTKLVTFLDNNDQLTQVTFYNGSIHINARNERERAYISILRRIAHLMPSLNLTINTHAQPLVMHNKDFDGMQSRFSHNPSKLGSVKIETKIQNAPQPPSVKQISSILRDTCNADPYRQSLYQGYGLFISPPQEFQTFQFAPMLSWSNYPGCTNDILIPSVFHYDFKTLNKAKHQNDFWKKKDSLLWRGTTSGSPFYNPNNTNYTPDHICVHNCTVDQYKITNPQLFAQHVWFYSHRQRAVTVANLYPKLVDVKFIGAVEMHPDLKTEVGNFYSIARRKQFHSFFDHKFILDLDGNGYSGRFLNLLHGNSLIFAGHYAEHWFSDLVIPFYHYVPVHMGFTNINSTSLTDGFKRQLSYYKTKTPKFEFISPKTEQGGSINIPLGYNDLIPKLMYYQNNLVVSAKMAYQGQHFAMNNLRQVDMDCFIFRAFVEMHDLLVKLDTEKSG